MTLPFWFLLGIGGVMLTVGGTIFDKYILDKYFMNDNQAGPGALIVFSSFFVSIVVFLIIVFKLSEIDVGLLIGATGFIVGIINGLWILLYLIAMNRVDVSKIVPIFQTVPIFGLLLGMFILGEFLTVYQILSGAIIIFGALFLLYESDGQKKSIDYLTLVLMLGASFLIAFSQVIFKQVSLETNYWTAAFWLGIGYIFFGICLFMFIRSYREQFLSLFKKRIASVFGVNAVNETFDNSGELIFLAAVILGPVALVQSLNAYEPLFVFLASITLAWFFPLSFQEDISRKAIVQKIIGILIVLGGSLFLYSAL